MAARKTSKRPNAKKPARSAVSRFTATRKGSVRADTDGGVWVKILPPTWLKSSNKKKMDKRTKRAAVKALKKFRKG